MLLNFLKQIHKMSLYVPFNDVNTIRATQTSHKFTLNSTQYIKNIADLTVANNDEYVQPQPVSVSNESNEQLPNKQNVFYGIEDMPSFWLTIFLGFQHYLLMAGGTLIQPLVLMPAMCMDRNDPDTGNIISTFLFVSGIVTILQTTFGIRLPIVQGGNFSYTISALALLNTERWKCPVDPVSNENRIELWQSRMREIQGAIIMSSFIQIALGFSGIFGVIMRRVTPISLASSVIVIGLSLLEFGSELCATDWPISIFTMIVIIIFSQYLRHFKIPIPFTRLEKRNGMRRYPMFQIFPVLLSIIVCWTLCAILTISGALHEKHAARTDIKMEIIKHANWFRIPVPFQWGYPTFTVGAAIGFLSAVFAGIVESLGEYQGVTKILDAPAPPQHAINRGVFMEGVGCLLCGIFGTGSGTTSYSENTGAISVTKVGSRRVFQMAGFIMMVISVIGKLGAFFVTIPDPIVGGVVSAMVSIIITVGISSLQNVNLTRARNVFIVGFSVPFALSISKWVAQNEKEIKFGNEELNIALQIVFRSSMFIAAVTSFILDNSIPGTMEERGLAKYSQSFAIATTKVEPGYEKTESEDKESLEIYNLPFGMPFLKSKKIATWFPISPTFTGSNYSKLLLRLKKSISS